MRRLDQNQTFHLAIFALSLVVVVASVLLTPSDSAVSLFGFQVPPLCMWKNLTGLDCPGCGLTRSFTYMGHGEISLAFERHRLGPLLYLAVAGLVPWHGWKLLRSLWPRRAVV